MADNDFHKEESHETFALLFDSYNIEEKFRHKTSFPYKIVKDKEENRLAGMLHSAENLGASFAEYQRSAIACVCIAVSQEEALLMTAGLIKVTPQGIAVCSGCLEKAIATCEENLAVLKDIQEAAAKAYAK